ncbi:MAG: 16S rRNA (guanine(527)-N(7))-methyltransferase RsmG [Rhodospirillales bacterium]
MIEQVEDAATLARLLELTDRQKQKLERYAALLETWNKGINLVSRRDLDDLWHRHMFDSAQLLPLLPPAPLGRQRRLVDLGSGGGFPGLVLAVLGAGDVHLLESDGRKVAFLEAVSRETETPITLHSARIESLAGLSADCVTARALAPLPKLLGYVARHLAPQGRALLLKGRRLEVELTAAREAWSMEVSETPSRSHPDGRIVTIERLAPRRNSGTRERRRP